MTILFQKIQLLLFAESLQEALKVDYSLVFEIVVRLVGQKCEHLWGWLIRQLFDIFICNRATTKVDIVMPIKEEQDEFLAPSVVNCVAEVKPDVAEDLSYLANDQDQEELIRTQPVTGVVNERQRRPLTSQQCGRCKQFGHYANACPTRNDTTYDPPRRLSNIPNTSRKFVTELTGVDVANKTVIFISLFIAPIDMFASVQNVLSHTHKHTTTTTTVAVV
jgi:hypothetical protein